jgi:hypothetical protein
VPWRLIGLKVTVTVSEQEVRVYASEQVACHAESAVRRATVIDPQHLVGVVGAHLVNASWLIKNAPRPVPEPARGSGSSTTLFASTVLHSSRLTRSAAPVVDHYRLAEAGGHLHANGSGDGIQGRPAEFGTTKVISREG